MLPEEVREKWETNRKGHNTSSSSYLRELLIP